MGYTTRLLGKKLEIAAESGSVTLNRETDVLPLQDDFGRASDEDIRDLWDGLNRRARRTLIWLAFAVLSEDQALSILRMTAIRDERAALLADADNYLAERLAEWNDRETAIAEKEADLERREADLGRSLAEVLKVERANVVLRGQVDALEAENDALRRKLAERSEAEDLVKGLASLIESK